jgi:broad-specificity NMP kinase
MIDICPKCGNYEWNKEISKEGKQIICQSCGHNWSFKAMPLFILTGCSGVGKTTTCQELLQRDINFLVMDVDIFSFMPGITDNDYRARFEQVMNFSKVLMQGGKPLLWANAALPDSYEDLYNRRFFKDIYSLALVCDSNDLVKRMREGRGIEDENWIKSSVEYNQWFIDNGKTYEYISDIYDITGKSTKEVADYVDQWVNSKL